ncbi:hypothetical protein [Streptomyces sp. NRRL F-5630]|nr:hypothetical protein [Streptomyces sp. NRRL F-5630]
MTHEPNTRVVRALPDTEPVERLPRAAMAKWPWLTEEFLNELEDE